MGAEFKEYLDNAETAEFLGITVSSLRNLTREAAYSKRSRLIKSVDYVVGKQSRKLYKLSDLRKIEEDFKSANRTEREVSYCDYVFNALQEWREVTGIKNRYPAETKHMALYSDLLHKHKTGAAV